MRIGVDLDGVIFDSEKGLRVYSELYEILELKKNTKRDNEELGYQKRFNWTKEETTNFYPKHRDIVLTANLMPGAKDVLELLKKDGHELFLITARGSEGERSVIEPSKERLLKEGLNFFTNMYWAVENKAEVCKAEKIDIMIDDGEHNCRRVSDAGIQVIYMKDAPCRVIDHPLVKTLYNWGEIYRYFSEMK